MSAAKNLLDDVAIAPQPATGERRRAGVASHRGRSIRYVCAATSPNDRAALVDLLAELLKRPAS